MHTYTHTHRHIKLTHAHAHHTQTHRKRHAEIQTARRRPHAPSSQLSRAHGPRQASRSQHSIYRVRRKFTGYPQEDCSTGCACACSSFFSRANRSRARVAKASASYQFMVMSWEAWKPKELWHCSEGALRLQLCTTNDCATQLLSRAARVLSQSRLCATECGPGLRTCDTESL